MTRVLLIHAGPTPWDAENRIVGGHNLPLTDDAAAAGRALVGAIGDPVTAVCCTKGNDAVEFFANLLCEKFDIKCRYVDGLQEVTLGLWEGLTREELHFRYPTVVPQWEREPLGVIPPEGETLLEAVLRVEPTLKKILKRNRDGVIALALRPLVLQIVNGLLHLESPQTMAAHMQNVDVIQTVDLSDQQLDDILSAQIE
jgi:broad specificity phosphatase PhoE